MSVAVKSPSTTSPGPLADRLLSPGSLTTVRVSAGGDRPGWWLHNGRVRVPVSTLLRRGARRRCPVCGNGGLFRQWIRMAERCPTCGLTFERVPGQWLGSWFLNICLAQMVVVAILVVGVGVTWPDPPMVPIAVAAGLAAVGVPVAFFPWSRTLWLAIDLAMRPLDFDEGVAPGFELAEDLERLHDDDHGGHGRAA
ncbi:MAG TPA: DUF983 domain-containing protein [Acidimicrobiales bacterium]